MDAVAARWLAFAQLAAGVLILTAGAIQCGFWRPRRRDGRSALGLLGIAGMLYGVRLLIDVPDERALFPVAPIVWRTLQAWITYVLPVPLVAFFELTFGRGWRQSIRALRIAVTVYAVGAIAIDLLTHTPGAAMAPNAYLVIAAIVLLNSFGSAAARFDGWHVVRVGLLVFSAFVLFQNLISEPLLRDAWNVEWAARPDARGAFFDGERLCDFSRTAHAGPADAFASDLVHHLGSWSGRPAARGSTMT